MRHTRSPSTRIRPAHAWMLLAAASCLALLAGLTFGAATIPPTAWWQDSAQAQLVSAWRAPRVATAFAVGACLSMAGLIFQGIFRNPLAEPYLLGSAAGAGLGAACALLLPFALPFGIELAGMAFIGAFASSWLVLAVGGAGGNWQTGRLLLAGVALAAILSALRGMVLLIFGDESTNLRAIVSWQMGGIQTPDWLEWSGLATATLLVLFLALPLARGLDALGLGEETAHSMGIRVKPFAIRAISIAALATALAVTWGGLIGFIGLIVPHLARWWLGPLHRRLLPAVAVAGGGLMVVVDTVARAALPPSEIPAGILTALVGGPFFLFLLLRQR